MDLYNASAWLHHPPSPVPDSSQHAQHEGRQSAANDWKEPSTATSGAGSSSDVQPSLDLSDFTLDIPGEQSLLEEIVWKHAENDVCRAGPSTSSSSNSSQPFYGHAFQNNYFLPSTTVPGPYNAMAYGATWGSQSHLPLSNYSSLNGATSASSSGSLSQQQSSSPQPMMIEYAIRYLVSIPCLITLCSPALTTMNGSSSNGMQHPYTSTNYASQTQQQHSQYPFQQHLHPSALSINPSFVHASHYFQPQPPAPAPQQGTLSPHALHSPSSSIMSTIMPSTFYTSSSTSSSASTPPHIKKEQFQLAIKPLLQASSFTGAQAVNSLVTLISDYGSQDVDAATRLEILTKIRDQAGNHYFRAWSENTLAIDISREWLKAAFTAKNDGPLVETIMPLLHVSEIIYIVVPKHTD
jgi:protein phosphatase 1 regulatory subunit 10